MISNKCNYALRAMLELAKREGGGPVTIQDVARAQSIPVRFLEAILRELKDAGLTASIRGKHGGYVLAKPARQITLGDVMRRMDGPVFVSEPAGNKSAPAGPNVFQAVWKEAEGVLNEVYDRIQFEQLAEEDRQRMSDFTPDYTI